MTDHYNALETREPAKRERSYFPGFRTSCTRRWPHPPMPSVSEASIRLP